jgi:hypothetical protein
VIIAAYSGFSIIKADLNRAYRNRLTEMSEEQLGSVAVLKTIQNKVSVLQKI